MMRAEATMIYSYETVRCKSQKELDELVTLMVSHGYQPQGGPMYIPGCWGQRATIVQALVRTTEADAEMEKFYQDRKKS